MKKKLAVLLAASLAVLMVMTGCGSTEKKTFTVGFDAEYPPYGYMDDNGDYTGFDLELAQEVATRLGLEYVPQPIA